jgi:hypothetical protein
LKKQSQFAPARIGVKPYIKGDYGNITALSARKNKANQSQFINVPRSAFCVQRREKKRNLKKQSQFCPAAGRNQLKPGVK